jgi:hypothetical protein
MESSSQRSIPRESNWNSTNQVQKSYLCCWTWFVVAIIIVVVAGFRYRLLDVPLERDEGEYAYAGQLILQGVAPYNQVYNMKLPGIYAAYAVIMAIFGQSCSGIHLGLLVVNAVTTILVFLLTRFLIDSFAGVFAAAAFAVLSMAEAVQGIFANAEHFVILFALAGILLLLLSLDRNSLILLMTASLLLGIGFLMKQHGIAFIVFAGLYLLFAQIRRKPFELKAFIIRAVLFAVGVLLPFAVTCLILWQVGVFKKFWFWTFVYAREYVAIRSLSNGLEDLKFRLMLIVSSTVLIWISAAIGLVTLFLKKSVRSQSPFVIGFLILSFLATCPGLYFRPHYFVLLLPAIALTSGIGLFGIRHALRDRKTTIRKNLVVVLLGLAVLSYTLHQQKKILLAERPDDVSRTIYGRNPFPESLKIAEYIKANSSSDDKIAVLGSEPQIFFYSDRRSASSYVYVYPLMEPHPYALQMQKEMIQQIETAKPKFLIFVHVSKSWLLKPASKRLIFDWFEQYTQRYCRLVGVIDILSTNQTIYRWNENAVEYTPRSESRLAVFERKSGI